jgi:two-component system, OmpR family, phosphate regulon sensor histidine kinase PhoR
MNSRRSLRFPITLGTVMFVLLALLLVGWVLLNVIGAQWDPKNSGFYWTLLSVGATLLVVLIVGTAFYLTISVKAINLNRRQSNFIDSVTHELKSPIASLKLYLQTLSRHPVPQHEQDSFYRTMLDDVERLDQLTTHILDAARLERGEIQLEREEVDIPKVLKECVESVRGRFRIDHDAISLEADPCIILDQRTDVMMVFRNLVDNAVKYAGTPPKVHVDCRFQANIRQDDQVNYLVGKAIVQISDNGKGIPAAYRSKVFGRFVRLGSELEREKPGTGLGLYIVRTLVNRLRGRVKIRDSEQGHGTVFEVQLPAQQLITPQENG